MAKVTHLCFSLFRLMSVYDKTTLIQYAELQR